MTPYYQDDWVVLYHGDCRAVLSSMPERSVHAVVTSPPYWGLRDYGVDAQIGLEPTPEAYTDAMVGVFREVRRVLRDDGTLWLNMGDSYARDPAKGGAGDGSNGKQEYNSAAQSARRIRSGSSDGTVGRGDRAAVRNGSAALKPKDLVGVPWRLAFALQADGWYLRSDIVWAKPNPMPESVTDRPTKAHEYVFLLSRGPQYFYDADAVREAGSGQDLGGRNGSGCNLRSVWTIPTEPYHGAHFATFPRRLVEPCVKAGTSKRGVCPECGAPWTREVERERTSTGDWTAKDRRALGIAGAVRHGTTTTTTTGWRASCSHGGEPVPATVLDPFAGTGTTLLVAQALERRALGIDINPEYLHQALSRNAQVPLGLGA